MRTPFFIWLARTSRPATIGAFILLGAACSDMPSTPDVRHAPSPNPRLGDSALAIAIDKGQHALASLKQARQRPRSPAADSLLDRQIELLSKRIDGWRLRASGGGLARDEIEAGALKEGIIIDEETWSRVELTGWGDTPLVTLMTTLSTPALVIGTVTSGSSTVRGKIFPINASFSDYGWYSFRQFHLPEVDCSKAGAYVTTGTWHYANWFYSSLSSSTGWARSTASDSCPAVAPIPHFTLSAQGKVADNDDGIFEVSTTKGNVVGVTLTPSNMQVDAPIKTYRWLKNGVQFAEGASVTLWVSLNNTGVTLEVIDMNGLKGHADGVIALTFNDGTLPPPPPPPRPEEPTGGGTGGGSDPSPPSGPTTQPPVSVASWTCEQVYEKMRVDWGLVTYYYWQDLGRECGWADSANRLSLKPMSLTKIPAVSTSSPIRQP